MRVPFLLGALLPLGALVWLALAPGPRTSEEQFAAAGNLLDERINDLRTRTSQAARRMEDEGVAADARGFEAARAIRTAEGVDGVAILDAKGKAQVWSGRTFEIDPEIELGDVIDGVVAQGVLDHPVHLVLYTARPVGDFIAIAFAAFNEVFPVRRDLGEAIAAQAGLYAAELRYGAVPVSPESNRERHTKVIPNLVHATFVASTEDESEYAALQERHRRARVLLMLALAWLGSLGLYWLARTRWLPLAGLLFIALLRGLMATFNIPDSAPAQALASGIAALAAIAIVRRTPLRPRTLAGAALLVCSGFAALRWHAFVEHLAAIGQSQGLFDPTTSVPGWNAALLLAAAAAATLALILLLASAIRHMLPAGRWRFPFGSLERVASLALLTTVVLLPVLHASHRHSAEHEIASHARRLLEPESDTEAERRMDEAVRSATDPDRGANFLVAAALEDEESDRRQLAFFLWSASRWNPRYPCAVEVYDTSLDRVSSFDFDAPPSALLPLAPSTLKSSKGRIPGRGAGASIHYRVRAFPIHTIAGDEEPVGIARFVMPVRWDLLRSRLRAPMISEPFAALGRGAAEPLLIAELDDAGAPRFASKGSPTDLPRPGPALLAEAREEEHASMPVSFEGRDARMLVVPGEGRFVAIVYASGPWGQLPFEAAHLLFVLAIACAIWLVWRWRQVAWAFRHTIALFLVLLSVLPVVLIGVYQKHGIEQRYEKGIEDELRDRLNLVETLLSKREAEVDNDWCVALSTDHHIDLNIYDGPDLIATSRPGVWDTGLVSRRLAAPAYEELVLRGRREYLGQEPFAAAGELRAGYRKLADDRILSVPELTDRRALERGAAEETARLVAFYVLAAALAVLLALPVAYLLLRPVRRLQGATQKVASGNLDVELSAARGRGELGDLERSFASMTRDLREVQDLRVRTERLAAWRAMAQQIAHDVKNPLTPMKLTVQNLLALHEEDRELFDEEFARGSNVILEEIDRLQRIAGNFSTYARVPARRLEDLDLGALLNEVAELHGAAGSIDVKLPDGPVHVHADRDELHRVLHNLIINAREASARHIVLTCQNDARKVRLVVSDDGRGIPPAAMDRIFEPSFTTNKRGTGLGLPIVQRIIEDMGGSIALDSEPGRGTRVTIWLPSGPATRVES
jgi:signal transduction histidine kinase